MYNISKQMENAKVDKFEKNNGLNHPQCQYFVVRKKRLCRMTVRPGQNYCGEHEPQPRIEKGKDDTRIPCPYDSKHTCYASKLEKHLAICNARQLEVPDYISHNINVPSCPESAPRVLLSQISQDKILALIDKVNILYDNYVKDTITTFPDHPIHDAVLEDFSEEGRSESSLRHLRQASSLLHLAEAEGLVQDGTCYVELGAGKGHVSYYAYKAWCKKGAGSSVLLVDRASLRHKRDNKLRESQSQDVSEAMETPGAARCDRVRADLAHLALSRVPAVVCSNSVVGLAKHLCGVATDYALRCLAAADTESPGLVSGAALATCCHHRCDYTAYVGNSFLQEIGIDAEEFNIILGLVSWATCGHGRPRQPRPGPERGDGEELGDHRDLGREVGVQWNGKGGEEGDVEITEQRQQGRELELRVERGVAGEELSEQQRQRREVGGRAKLLLDAGRARYLRGRGFDARLCYFVPSRVSLENVCIVASRP